MANVLLGVTGSVAAIYTPDLYQALTKAHHRVKVVATQAALYFFDPATIDSTDSSKPTRNPEIVIIDADEWPGRSEGQHYERTDKVLHIELRRWADLFVIAPLDANTLAKLAGGLCDNCLTCVWRAWDRARPVILAPAMNTLMWEHPLTLRHVRQLAADFGAQALPADLDLQQLIAYANAQCPNLHLVPPRTKRLACDDVGIGAMAALDDIVTTAAIALARST